MTTKRLLLCEKVLLRPLLHCRSRASASFSQATKMCRNAHFFCSDPNQYPKRPLTTQAQHESFYSSELPCLRLIEDVQVGSMTNDDWEDAARVLNRCHHCVEWAWKVLDRLVAEERHAQMFSSALYETHLSTDLLNKAVDAWRSSPQLIMDPNLILAKIKGYAPQLYPDVRTYSMLVDAVTKKGNDPKQAPIFATLILDRMQREYAGGNSQVQPNDYTYGVVLNAWAKSGLPEAANKTLQILQQMENGGVMPTPPCYHAAIASGPRDGPRAEALLEKLLSSSKNVEAVVAYSFGVVLNVWSKSGAPDAAQRALAIFHRMKQLHKTRGDDTLKPNAYIYTSVLVTLGRSGQPQAAEDFLRQMQQNYEATGDVDMRPTVVAYNAVMDAWSRSNQDPKGPLRAESLLKQMISNDDDDVSPNTISFNCVIAGWSRSRDPRAAQKAESILAMMLEMNKAGHLDVTPNTITYNTVIAALSKGRHFQAAERAEATLEQMKMLHEKGNRDVKPNTRTFNSVIAAWSRSKHPQAAERAESVLERMHKLHQAGDPDVIPNTITYGSVIATWSRSRDPQAALKAESVLQRMHTLYNEGNREVKPNTICYNSALAAWSKCQSDPNAAERAESLLRRMQEMHKNAGDLDVKPDAVSYSCVIQGWSKSKDPKAMQRISVLKEELNRLKR